METEPLFQRKRPDGNHPPGAPNTGCFGLFGIQTVPQVICAPPEIILKVSGFLFQIVLQVLGVILYFTPGFSAKQPQPVPPTAPVCGNP